MSRLFAKLTTICNHLQGLGSNVCYVGGFFNYVFPSYVYFFSPDFF